MSISTATDRVQESGLCQAGCSRVQDSLASLLLGGRVSSCMRPSGQSSRKEDKRAQMMRLSTRPRVSQKQLQPSCQACQAPPKNRRPANNAMAIEKKRDVTSVRDPHRRRVGRHDVAGPPRHMYRAFTMFVDGGSLYTVSHEA